MTNRLKYQGVAQKINKTTITQLVFSIGRFLTMKFLSRLFTFVKAILVFGVILLAVLVYRTYEFTPNNSNEDKVPVISIDYSGTAERLAGALKFKTISHQDPSLREPQQFLDFHAYIKQNFPLVDQQLELTKINQLSLLYRWPGKTNSQLKPILLMGHFDVVPVDPTTLEDWKFPPFEGVVEGGNIWGRGTLDDKGAVLAILEAIEFQLSQGFTPNRDIYFSFGHDEEVGGNEGAAKAAEYFKSKGIKFEYVLDEGGFVTERMMPGFELPLALIGVAEKGYLSAQLSVESTGGHSSVPPPSTGIGILSQAIVRLENNQLKPRLVHATESMLTTIGKNMPFSKRLIFANLWLFEPFLIDQLVQSKLTNATIRTTTAATVFKAGDKENALPINSKAIVNFRLLPGDSIQTVESHIVRTIADERVKVKIIKAAEATPISSTESKAYIDLVKTIDQVSPEQGMVIVPNLMVGGTDSSHFVALAENVYRFNGVKINPESFSGFHGTNEYLPVAEYQRAINFYSQILLLNSDQ